MRGSFATIIMAGGRGSRMGSSDRHKVCFPVLGVPCILRALETYNLCGSALNVIVVGMLAENVMATVSERFPSTVFAFQREPRGTGDAVRQGVRVLEAMAYGGDVLVVAGDKVVEPRVVREMLAQHRRTDADVTVAVREREARADGGIVLTTSRGRIAGIMEAWDVRRLEVLGALNKSLAGGKSLSSRKVVEAITAVFPPSKAPAFFGPLWDFASSGRSLRAAAFEQWFSAGERAGSVRLGRSCIPAADVARRFPLQNLSTYLFKSGVLYAGMARLPTAAAGAEEYFTDVITLLASGKRPARIRGYKVSAGQQLMGFNDPQELLEIESTLRARQQAKARTSPVNGRLSLARAGAWLDLCEKPSAKARAAFSRWYGRAGAPLPEYRRLLQAFIARFGDRPQVALVRSPGRINLMGRHIDHQGGSVNVMAINREILVAAAPRDDDRVTVANVASEAFQEHVFRISNEVAHLDWDDWLHTIDGPRLQRILEAARGEWVNYVKASILRLQEQFRDRSLHGMDMMVLGGIPMGAGLSSSSALVVATAELTAAFNGLPVTARRLVSLCGEGEWFVGTRGGAADHAAIRLSRRGMVTRVGFFPFRLEASAPFYDDHDLVVCESGIYAGKSAQARHRFNEKVTCYHLGRAFFKLLRPDLGGRIEHLRDIQPDRLGLSPAEVYGLLAHLPRDLTRSRAEQALQSMAPAERAPIERLFATHDAPAQGYDLRGVVLFGLAEMARARRCLDLLRRGDAAALGRLMEISHDGDRVSVPGNRGRYRRLNPEEIEGMTPAACTARHAAALERIPGAYGCSLPELDRIADTLTGLPGVRGAQMAGAGLGGCVMALVQSQHTEEVTGALQTRGLNAHVFRPIAGACALRMT